MINSKFEAYGGSSVNGSKVAQLLAAIRAHNVEEDKPEKRIGIQGVAPRESITGGQVSTYSSAISSSKKYKVSFNYESKTGRIESVSITQL